MESHHVMKEVLKKSSAKHVAAEMGVSLSLVYKWTEQEAEGGTYNPLERVGQLLRATGDARLAQWVCEQTDGFFIHNPTGRPRIKPLIPMTNDIVHEFA